MRRMKLLETFRLHWGGFLVDICLSTRCSKRQASSLLLPTALASTSTSHWRCFQKNSGKSIGFTLSLVKSTSPTMAFCMFGTIHLFSQRFVWSDIVLLYCSFLTSLLQEAQRREQCIRALKIAQAAGGSWRSGEGIGPRWAGSPRA